MSSIGIAVRDLAEPKVDVAEAPGRRRKGLLYLGGRRVRVWRLVVFALAGAYFLVPLWAAFRFSLEFSGTGWSFKAYSELGAQQGFGPAIWLSAQLAIVTTAAELLLMVPTAVYVHLRLPKVRRAMDFLTSLPIVVPPVVLILGVLAVSPARLKSTPFLLALEYVVLAVPLSWRTLDAGVQALDLHTLVDASRSLGGGWGATLWRVLLPNMRVAILSTTVLTVALVLGEFTMASLDLQQTFPTWIYVYSQYNGHVSVAASMLSLFVTWLVLLGIAMVAGRRGRREISLV
jgi:putative spermidine/putrescine transport system permease protein